MQNKRVLLPVAACLFLSAVAAEAANTQIQASDSGKVTVQGDVITSDGDVTLTKTYGLSIEQYKAEQQKDREILLKEIRATIGDEKKLHALEQKLKGVEEKLTNLQKSYKEEIQGNS